MPTKKAKYFYNAHTLKYEKVVVTWKQLFFRWMGRGAATLVLAGCFAVVAFYAFDSPKEKQLKRENARLKFEFEMLNKKADHFGAVLSGLQKRDDNMYRVIFEAEPIPTSIREAGFGGTNRYLELEFYENANLMIRAKKRFDKLSKQLYIQSKSYDEIQEMIKNKSQMLASIPAIQPIANKDLQRIASGFGQRIHPIYKTPRMHTGMDFTAPVGTNIYCTGDGVVVKADNNAKEYGRNITVDHGFGYMTLYAHMNEFNVRKGQKVKRGDVLGTVGNSGLSTAPHLHYEVIRDGVKINPINYFYNDLTPEEYEKVIEMASQHNQSFD